MLSNLQTQLIDEARQKDREIRPIGGKAKHDEESFTIHKDRYGDDWLYFWYDNIIRSTRIVRSKI